MLINFILFITIVFTLTGFLGQFGYWPDLTAHFRLQYLAVQLICIIFYILSKKWRLLLVSIFVALINLSLIIPLYIPANLTNANGKTISIMLFNVNTYNNQYAKVIEYVNQMKPDILALEEINDQWILELGNLLDAYPYKKFESRRDNFGIGLFSKISLESVDIRYFGSVGVPSVLAKLILGGKPVTVLLTHPLPPGSFKYYQFRNEQLQEIASQRGAFEERLILVGDLNTTSWSFHFRDFIKKMGLLDSRCGFGLQITWPSTVPLLGITIDHILVSKNFKVLDRLVGPDIGSDHYPVYIKLQMD